MTTLYNLLPKLGYLMNGKCVLDLASCINDAGPMQVAATKECYEYALKHFVNGDSSIVFEKCSGSTNLLILSVSESNA